MNKNDTQQLINRLKKNSFYIGLFFVLGGLALIIHRTYSGYMGQSYEILLLYTWLSAEIIGGVTVGISEILYGTKYTAICKTGVFGTLLILSLIGAVNTEVESNINGLFLMFFLSFTIVLVILILMLSIKHVLLFIKKQRSKNKL